MSSESGIKTFRDPGGLWEEYDVSEIVIDGISKTGSLYLDSITKGGGNWSL